MLERMWEPTLGGGKMAWVTSHKKQKAQLFEEQIKLKLIVVEPGKAHKGLASSKEHC